MGRTIIAQRAMRSGPIVLVCVASMDPFQMRLPTKRHAASGHGNASVNCGATHSAVGAVTLIQTGLRRAIRIPTKPYGAQKPMVGTTKRSMAEMSDA